MSRGLGVWQRRLLAALEERPTVSLVDVLPRPYARSQYVALHRAAWSLRGKGKVDIHHAQRKDTCGYADRSPCWQGNGPLLSQHLTWESTA